MSVRIENPGADNALAKLALHVMSTLKFPPPMNPRIVDDAVVWDRIGYVKFRARVRYVDGGITVEELGPSDPSCVDARATVWRDDTIMAQRYANLLHERVRDDEGYMHDVSERTL